MGLMDEDSTNNTRMGFQQAKASEKFSRIGVDVVRNRDNNAYQAFKTYDILEHGAWRVKKGKDRIEFAHTLTTDLGYSYVYRKTVRLARGKPVMTIEHSLKNTGTKAIETAQYNHNF